MNENIVYKNDPTNFVEISVGNKKRCKIITNPSSSFLNNVVLRTEAVKYVNSVGMSYKLLEGMVAKISNLKGAKLAFDLTEVNVHPFIYSGYRSNLYFVTEIKLEDHKLNLIDCALKSQKINIVSVKIDTVKFMRKFKRFSSCLGWISRYVKRKNITGHLRGNEAFLVSGKSSLSSEQLMSCVQTLKQIHGISRFYTMDKKIITCSKTLDVELNIKKWILIWK
jgi:hypothetical protein